MSELTPREILAAFDAGLADAAHCASLTQQQTREAAPVSEIASRQNSVQKDNRADVPFTSSTADSLKGHAR